MPRFSTRSPTSWRTTILSAIIRVSQTDSCNPAPSLNNLTRCNADSASVGCSTITTAPPPDRRRFCFWTKRVRVLAEQLLAQALACLEAAAAPPLTQQHELIREPTEYAEFFRQRSDALNP